MQETNEIDLEEYVKETSEEKTCEGCEESACEGCSCNNEDDVAEDAFAQFEEWADATEQGKLTDDQVNLLKSAIGELPQSDKGPELDLVAANDFFSDPEFGLTELPNFEELTQALENEQSRDEEIRATPFQLFQAWAKENYPELETALGMTGAAQPPAPEAPPAAPVAAPAPEAPVAEGKGGSMVQEVAKIVKSFYNRDNPDVGPFRGEEGIATDVEKQIAEKFGESAGQQARQMAEQFMEKLSGEWQQRHGSVSGGHNAPDRGDGLARLKELVGGIKQKVEGMGEEKNPQHSHQYDTTMKHANNPSVQQRMAGHDIKPGVAGYRDRIDMLKDLERTGKMKDGEQEEGQYTQHYMDANKPSKVRQGAEADKAAPNKPDWKRDPIQGATDSAINVIKKLAGLHGKK